VAAATAVVPLAVAAVAQRAQVPRLVPAAKLARHDVIDLDTARPAPDATPAVTLEHLLP
jgi:hypothetical protein